MTLRTTWDGLPISEEPPFGATVVVYRHNGARLEILLLHRAHHGPDYPSVIGRGRRRRARACPTSPSRRVPVANFSKKRGSICPYR